MGKERFSFFAVRHLESSFASSATTWSLSTCTCTSTHIQAKFCSSEAVRAWTVFLIGFDVALLGFVSSLLCGCTVEYFWSDGYGLWGWVWCWGQNRKEGAAKEPFTSCCVLHDSRLLCKSQLGLPKVGLPHCLTSQSWNTTYARCGCVYVDGWQVIEWTIAKAGWPSFMPAWPCCGQRPYHEHLRLKKAPNLV